MLPKPTAYYQVVPMASPIRKGRQALIYHTHGNPFVTQQHMILTSPVTKVLKNKTFYTHNTKYILDNDDTVATPTE